jgi:general secretion pathway protein B
MSILLEALRKSEKNKKKHSVPTIHSDDQSGPVLESFRFGPLVLTLIVAALVVGGWFIWRQYRVPDDAYGPPVTLVPDKSPVVADQASGSQPAGGEAAEMPSPATVNDNPAQSTSTVNNTAPKARTPVESFQRPASSNSSPGSANVDSAIVGSPSGQASNSGDRQSVSQTSTSSAPVPATPKPNVPHKPEPIGYWELPDAVRSEVPEIKFSVLVYAKNPEDRFVLVNGQRLGEGDSVQSGLLVQEIRRDGVVFSYRLYQFLVER